MNILTNKKIIVVGAVSVLIALSLTACGSKENKNQSTATNEASVEQKKSEDTNKVKKDEKTTEKQNSSKKVAQNTANLPKFTKQFLGKNVKPEFATAWKNSENGTFSVCIDGKGPNAAEEGIGKILVKDKDGDINSFELSDKKLTPKYLEWVNDENLFVILASSHGTVAKGGNLYMVNANTGKVTSIIETSDKKQQIMSTEKSGNNLKLKVNVFNDDNFDKSHIENWIISSFDASMNNTMEVKNSEGKVMYTIN